MFRRQDGPQRKHGGSAATGAPASALRGRLSYANVAATLALFIALGATAIAAITLARDSEGSPQVSRDSVRSLSGVLTANGAAVTGDLVQKPGAAGCLSVIGFCSRGRALDFAETVAVSPNGKNAYVASGLGVTVFDRTADGTLAQKPGSAGCISDSGAGRCADGTGLDPVRSVTVSPDGTSVYVAFGNIAGGGVAVFDRAPNGRLAQKPGADGCISDSGDGVCFDGRALTGSSSVTVSPDGTSVYVAGTSSDGVAVFDRASNGTLTQKSRGNGCISEPGGGECADGTALDAPVEVVVSPDGESVYAAMALNDAVAVFERRPNGRLVQKPGADGCISETGADGCVDGTGLDAASSVTVSPDGRSVYVASANTSDAVAMFDRRRNGRLVQKPGADGCISETAAGPCIDGRGLDGAQSVIVSADGQRAYVAAAQSDAVTMFDRAPNGTLAQKPAAAGCISETGAGLCVDGAGLDGALSVAATPDGGSIYVASSESDAVAVFEHERSRPGRP